MGANPHISALLRREIRSDANKRYLRSLPPFKTDGDLPDRLLDLLKQLDQVHRGGH